MSFALTAGSSIVSEILFVITLGFLDLEEGKRAEENKKVESRKVTGERDAIQ